MITGRRGELSPRLNAATIERMELGWGMDQQIASGASAPDTSLLDDRADSTASEAAAFEMLCQIIADAALRKWKSLVSVNGEK